MGKTFSKKFELKNRVLRMLVVMHTKLVLTDTIQTMKNLNICLVLASMIFVGCKDDDQVVNETTLPQTARVYLDTHFPTVSISRVERERDDNRISYDVYLQNSLEVEFDESGQVSGIDGQRGTYLPDSVIPSAVLEYIKTNYSNYFIVEWDIDARSQEIQLSNGVELIFDLNGGFLRIDS